MKRTYQNPNCTLVTLSSADVVTVSGTGEIFNWNDGVRAVDEGTAMNDGYGN